MLFIKKLYEDYKSDVFYYLVSITHDSDLSEDLTSETFLAAIKSISRYKGNADIKTWLFSIARYKWYEHLRKRKNEVSFDDLAEIYIQQNEDIENRLYRSEIAKMCLTVLDKEPEQARNIVKMRIEGFSYYEIAKRYGISESSARVINFRTKKRIRQILEKRYGDMSGDNF
ncbi:sigma-70 family RNA polymerase sigma factor [Tissierella pigra]|uniref:Sigma-70 family RNA polymerase sigma factor n=1 Tax=Tissierella pigra TaxID=2607614 RepID=A0A6N7XX89_9FIRM|nr:sigma-70 family RNA polymerase sigma factor [Tissierella pigra]MBU5427670.1 sigma-70 family RNA polymerase sigma factor [Tissierella pigra]MSU00420.1 sigma-70 family RNA polymerase sigma factor [Tissierella pigra]